MKCEGSIVSLFFYHIDKLVMFKFTAQASEELTFDGHLAASLVSDGGEGGDLQMMDVATVKGRGTMNPTLKSPFLWTWCFGLLPAR